MKSEPLFLALDNGTQSVRAMLFDMGGELVSKAQIKFEPYRSQKPGWAEYDALDYWEKLAAVCQELRRNSPEQFERVSGASLTTQRGTIICADDSGKALRPAILWLDQRQVSPPPMTTKRGRVMALATRLVGEGETLNYVRRNAESNWIRVHEPEVWARTAKTLTLAGYLTRQLVGEFVDSVASQVGFLPFDYKRLRWPDHYNWRCDAMGIDLEKLPRLIKPGALLGRITVDAARATGLPTGLPLYAAGGDKACEVLGGGCLDSSVASLSYGTTATINTTTARYFEPIPLLPSYPAAMPNRYTTEVSVYRGYWMVSWFKSEFGQQEVALEERTGIAAEKNFEQLLLNTPPGADGLVLLPYWSPGVRVPGPEARGALIGFSDVHTRAHVYRAMLEGIAFALREGGERIQRKSGMRYSTVRVSGGGAQSDAALQLTANIFNLPVERPHTFETSGLGAAINVAVGQGHYKDYQTAVRAMTRIGDRFNPEPHFVTRYDRIYREVYRPLFGRLQPLYKSIFRMGI